MSMTSMQQVERLQALLEKVKQNRDAVREAPASPARAAAAAPAPAQVPAAATPRAPAAAPAARKPAPPAQAPTTPVGMPTPVRRAPAVEEELDFSSLPPPGASRAAAAQEPAFTPAERRTRPGATPLEMAVEDTLDRPAVSPVVSQPARSPSPAAQPAAAVAPAAQRRDGVVLADPPPPTPGRPIAQTISKQPPVVPVSFGDLLKRSLSLRPR